MSKRKRRKEEKIPKALTNKCPNCGCIDSLEARHAKVPSAGVNVFKCPNCGKYYRKLLTPKATGAYRPSA